MNISIISRLPWWIMKIKKKSITRSQLLGAMRGSEDCKEWGREKWILCNENIAGGYRRGIAVYLAVERVRSTLVAYVTMVCAYIYEYGNRSRGVWAITRKVRDKEGRRGKWRRRIAKAEEKKTRVSLMYLNLCAQRNNREKEILPPGFVVRFLSRHNSYTRGITRGQPTIGKGKQIMGNEGKILTHARGGAFDSAFRDKNFKDVRRDTRIIGYAFLSIPPTRRQIIQILHQPCMET